MLVHGPRRLPPRQLAGERRATPAADPESKIFARACARGPSDDALIQRVRAGDEASFEAIFRRHHRALLSYCRHMLGDRDEAEDALQQSFIRAHKALTGAAPPRQLRPWLYAIARNCCLSAIAARRPTVDLEEGATPSLAGLSDQVRAREDLRELVADIARLPEDQRSALLLAELDDLSHQAIATVVGCPVSKVKALIYQARTCLIAERDARNASCLDIREQLSVAHGGELRRGPLRRHLSACAGCRDFQHAVAAQRQALAAVLPVLPSGALAARILGHIAAHGAGTASIGSAGAGIAPAGGVAATGTSVATSAGAGMTAVETAGATALAGAVSGTGTGALVGGGLLAKFALVGTVAALASVGAVAIPHRLAHGGKRTGRVDEHRVVRSPTALAAAAVPVTAAGPAPSPVGLAEGGAASGAAPGEGGLSGSSGVLGAGALGAEPMTVAPSEEAGPAKSPRLGSASSRERAIEFWLVGRSPRRVGRRAAGHRRPQFHHRRHHRRRRPIKRHRRIARVSARQHPRAMTRAPTPPRPPMSSPAPARPRRARSVAAARWRVDAISWAPSSTPATNLPTAKIPRRERPRPVGGDGLPVSASVPPSRSVWEHSGGSATRRDATSAGGMPTAGASRSSAGGSESTVRERDGEAPPFVPVSAAADVGATAATSGEGSSRAGISAPHGDAALVPSGGAPSETTASQTAERRGRGASRTTGQPLR
jgi:RNA polymerase sigma factor (sigma-70 family)